MAREKSAFLKRIEAARDAKQPLEVRPGGGAEDSPPTPDYGAMTDDELHAEIRRLSEEVASAYEAKRRAIELELHSNATSTKFVEGSTHSGETLADRLRPLQRKKGRHWS